MMFPFTALSCFDFDPGLFPIQTIDDAKNKSGKDSQANVARHEGHGGTTSDD